MKTELIHWIPKANKTKKLSNWTFNRFETVKCEKKSLKMPRKKREKKESGKMLRPSGELGVSNRSGGFRSQELLSKLHRWLVERIECLISLLNPFLLSMKVWRQKWTEKPYCGNSWRSETFGTSESEKTEISMEWTLFI